MKTLYCICLGLIIAVSDVSAEISQDAIRAFNTAIGSGDSAAISSASTALIDEAIANPNTPDATISAFEATKALINLGEYQSAKTGIEFTLGQPDTGDYPLLARRQLVDGYLAFKISGKRANRTALDTLLEERVDLPPSLLTIKIYRDRFEEAMQKARWRDAKATAGFAAQHFAQIKDNVPELYFYARMLSSVGYFADSKNRSSYEAFYESNAELNQFRAFREVDGPLSDQLEDLYWQSEAWALAMEAYFSSADVRLSPNALEAIDARYPLPEDSPVDDDVEDDPRPFCDGEFEMRPRMRYPSSAAWKGMNGAVILTLKTDETGAVIEPEVLAAVPVGGFEESAIKTVSQWRWVKAGDAEEGCRLSYENMVLPLVFIIG